MRIKFVFGIIVLVTCVSCSTNYSLSQSSQNTGFSESSITFSNATVEDVFDLNDPDAFFGYENIDRLQKEYESVKEELKRKNDIPNMIDNEITFFNLVEQSLSKVSADATWRFAYSVFDLSNSQFIDISQMEYLLDVDFTIFRKTDEYYNDEFKEVVWRLYTIVKSEIGGHLYIFFNYYTERNQTEMKATNYVPLPQNSSDYEHLKIGDSIDRVIELNPSALYIKKNPNFNYQKFTFHLLEDELLVLYYNDDLTIGYIQHHAGFWMPNMYRGKTGLNFEESIAFKSTMNNRTDFKILPQDYPPA